MLPTMPDVYTIKSDRIPLSTYLSNRCLSDISNSDETDDYVSQMLDKLNSHKGLT
jgi:hypothetical protein